MKEENIIYLKSFSQESRESSKKIEETSKEMKIHDPLEELLNEFKNFEEKEDVEETGAEKSKEEIERITFAILDIKERIKEQITLLKEFRTRFNYYLDEIEEHRD